MHTGDVEKVAPPTAIVRPANRRTGTASRKAAGHLKEVMIHVPVNVFYTKGLANPGVGLKTSSVACSND